MMNYYEIELQTQFVGINFVVCRWIDIAQKEWLFQTVVECFVTFMVLAVI